MNSHPSYQRPIVPPRPAMQRGVSRLSYPRLASADVGFYNGPTLVPPASLPTIPPALPQGGSDVTNFQGEQSALRTIESVRRSWSEEAEARRARREKRIKDEEERARREAEALAAAEAARAAAEAARLAAEAKAREEARIAREKALEEQARLVAEQQKLQAEEQHLAARKLELERKMAERQQAAAGFAAPIAQAVLPVAQPVSSAAAAASSSVVASSSPTPSQLAFQRSFMELTGQSNTAQVAALLECLNYDLDRAIAIFFSEDPPSMVTALEKGRSIQQNAQQQQQHAALHPHAHAAPSVANVAAQPTTINVLLPDNTPFNVTCQASDTFWTLYEKLSVPLSSKPAWTNKSFSFSLSTYPFTRFDEARFNISMREAGLVPSGTLKLVLA